jgi:hypothetical protein
MREGCILPTPATDEVRPVDPLAVAPIAAIAAIA